MVRAEAQGLLFPVTGTLTWCPGGSASFLGVSIPVYKMRELPPGTLSVTSPPALRLCDAVKRAAGWAWSWALSTFFINNHRNPPPLVLSAACYLSSSGIDHLHKTTSAPPLPVPCPLHVTPQPLSDILYVPFLMYVLFSFLSRT